MYTEQIQLNEIETVHRQLKFNRDRNLMKNNSVVEEYN